MCVRGIYIQMLGGGISVNGPVYHRLLYCIVITECLPAPSHTPGNPNNHFSLSQFFFCEIIFWLENEPLPLSHPFSLKISGSLRQTPLTLTHQTDSKISTSYSTLPSGLKPRNKSDHLPFLFCFILRPLSTVSSLSCHHPPPAATNHKLPAASTHLTLQPTLHRTRVSKSG